MVRFNSNYVNLIANATTHLPLRINASTTYGLAVIDGAGLAAQAFAAPWRSRMPMASRLGPRAKAEA
ncbi:hypothetical protein [Azohydromonas australica]|uniref:hypothetical protein n=1 Tax=Azohydromonas australica TaxID=364039 RepID=UPI0012EC4449|nr:hypothetical protein [Azohydromonas australica]